MDLHSLRVKELTDMCKRFGIKASGRKAEIVERLQSHPQFIRATSQGNGTVSNNKRSAAVDLTNSPSSAKKPKQAVKESHVAINKLFDEMADDEDPDTITDDGIESLCKQLGIDPQDPVILVLSWYMEAATMCVYTRDEFLRGLEKLRCSTIQDIKNKLPTLRSKLKNRDDFTDIYSYCFSYAKDPSQKSMALEIAAAMWELLLPGYFPLLRHWLPFVKANYRNSVSKDLWMQVLEFGHQVKGDLSNFDENGAWPVLIDDFVTHMQEKIASCGLVAVLNASADGDEVMEDA